MPRTLLKSLVLGAICLQLLACTTSSPQTTNITTPIHTSGWETALPGEQGSAIITFSLPQYATAEIHLLKGKSERTNPPIARISLTNENCTVGHLASLSTFNNFIEKIRYFEKETLWNSTHRLTLSWDNQRHLSVQLNDETIDSSLERKIDRLRLSSSHQPIYIEHIEFITK